MDTVEVIDEGVALDGLGSTVVVGELAVDYDFVAYLDVGVSALELAVAEVEDSVAVEIFGRGLAVFGNIEGGVAVGAAFGEGALAGDLVDLALDEVALFRIQ